MKIKTRNFDVSKPMRKHVCQMPAAIGCLQLTDSPQISGSSYMFHFSSLQQLARVKANDR